MRRDRNVQFMLSFLFIVIIPLFPIYAQNIVEKALPDGAIARFGKGGINTLHFSPDGSLLAIGTNIGVWLYNMDDGEEISLLTTQDRQINTLAFSQDGKYLASAGENNSVIHIWNLENGNIEFVRQIQHKARGLSSLIFHSGNTTLFGINMLGPVIVFDIKTGNEISVKKYLDTRGIGVLSEDKRIYIGSIPDEGIIKLWDNSKGINGEEFNQPETPTDNPLSKLLGGNRGKRNENIRVDLLTISPDNLTVASGHGKRIQLWDVKTRNYRKSLLGHRELIYTLAFSADSRLLASGSADNAIILWNVNTGRFVARFTGNKNSIKAVAFSPVDNSMLVSGGSDGTIRLWNTKDRKNHKIISAGYTDAVQAIAFSKDNKVLYSAASNGTVQIWDLTTRNELPSPDIQHHDGFSTLTFSDDATLYACQGQDTLINSQVSTNWKYSGPIRLYQLPKGTEISSFSKNTVAVSISPDNKIIATYNLAHGIQLWNMNTKQVLDAFPVDKSLSRSLEFSPDGRLLITSDLEHKTQVWDLTMQEEITPLGLEVTGEVAFSEDSRQMALVHDMGLDIWQITPTGLENKNTFTSVGYIGPNPLITFSPDGDLLLFVNYVSPHRRIKLWQVNTQEVIGTLAGHDDKINSLIFSHDGKILASGSEDGTILLWDWEDIIK